MRAALKIYASVHADAIPELKARIDGANRAIEDLVDTARTRAEFPQAHFRRRAKVYIDRRNLLSDRLALLQASAPPQRPAVAAEILGLIRSVRRWRDDEDLRRERQAWIGRLNRELAEVELRIRQVADSHAATHVIGFDHPSDLWLTKMVQSLTRRGEILEQLRAVGDDRAARARSVTAIVNSVGEMAIVDGLSPKMLSPDYSASRIEASIRDVDSQLAGLDEETRRFRDLTADRQRLQDQLGEARGRVEAHRRELASKLVSGASEGSLEHITELGRHVGDHPELSRALNAARGADSHLIAVVSELLEDRKP
jgi:hypothetical protein